MGMQQHLDLALDLGKRSQRSLTAAALRRLTFDRWSAGQPKG